MADIKRSTKQQSFAEIRQWDFDFAPDLATGVTVLSATATHIPPSGAPLVPVVGVIVGAIVPVALDMRTNTVKGDHVLCCVATLSDAETSELRVTIPVNF